MLVIAGCTAVGKQSVIPTTGPPNILLIVADDLGYSDIGAYGGEIPTATLDGLAKRGTLFTNFHTSPGCSTTRAMLYTGVDHHLAGLGTLAEIMTPYQRGRPGYEGFLNDRVVSVARLLRGFGYRSYLSGKWHLGAEPGQLPTDRGFDRFFASMEGGGNHFDRRGFAPQYPVLQYKQDGRDAAVLPPGHYSTITYTNKLLDFIESDHEAPFFAVLAYTAPHWPLQAPASMIAPHLRSYQKGWDQIRAERHNRMRSLRIIPDTAALPTRSSQVQAWEELSDLQRSRHARLMAIYAAMVVSMDENVGRLLRKLQRSGRLENSIVIFLSDNGAEARDISGYARYEAWLRANFETQLPTGDADSFLFAGPGWAQVSSTPLKFGKASLAEGGIRSPLVIADFRQPSPGAKKNDAFTTVMDIVPTILDIAGASHPGRTLSGAPAVLPMGESLVPMLKGEEDLQRWRRAHPVGYEYNGHNALILGDWKAVRHMPPYGKNTWELYNIAIDPGELRNLAQEESVRLRRMIGFYHDYAETVGVVPKAESAGVVPKNG